tara:strand:- start:2247 stop:2564 length:318 start_codon:yes stop_codon:yes gene_type:complete
MDNLAVWISDYGFPIIACLFLGYFVWYIWGWATGNIKPKIVEAQGILIALVDRIRMLDNDLIRLETKLNMVLEFKEEYEKMTGRKLDIDVDDIEEYKRKQAEKDN